MACEGLAALNTEWYPLTWWRGGGIPPRKIANWEPWHGLALCDAGRQTCMHKLYAEVNKYVAIPASSWRKTVFTGFASFVHTPPRDIPSRPKPPLHCFDHACTTSHFLIIFNRHKNAVESLFQHHKTKNSNNNTAVVLKEGWPTRGH